MFRSNANYISENSNFYAAKIIIKLKFKKKSLYIRTYKSQQTL